MHGGARHYTSPHLLPSVGLLPEAFQRHGYDTATFVSSFVLNSSWGLNRGFQIYDDHFGPRQNGMRDAQNVERRADETVGHLLAWFQARAQRGPAPRPFFVWLHLYDPHSPYDPPEPFHGQYAGRLYDGEVAYADSQLARLFDYLRKSGLYDRTLIVLLADHGESLGEHGEDEHSFFIYNSTLHVPLIFKLPRGEGAPRVVRRLVGTIDVAPTILELLHLRDPLSRQFQGTSLASDILGKGAAGARPVYSETYYPRDSFVWSELRCLTTDRYKDIQRARLLNSLGRSEEANALLQTIASEEPHFYLIPFLQAESFAQAHRWDDAERSYLACLKLNPAFEQAIMGLAYLYLRDEADAARAKPWLALAV